MIGSEGSVIDRGSCNRAEVGSLNTTADLSRIGRRQEGQVIRREFCRMGYGMC